MKCPICNRELDNMESEFRQEYCCDQHYRYMFYPKDKNNREVKYIFYLTSINDCFYRLYFEFVENRNFFLLRKYSKKPNNVQEFIDKNSKVIFRLENSDEQPPSSKEEIDKLIKKILKLVIFA